MRYSFKDWACTMIGPGGSALLGDGSGAAEDGMDAEPEGDKNVMTGGADGSYVHSLLAGRRGTVTYRCLKGSLQSSILQSMYALQEGSSMLWGINVIKGANRVSGDQLVCAGVAFKRQAPMKNAAEAGTEEWVFDVGRMEIIRGPGAALLG